MRIHILSTLILPRSTCVPCTLKHSILVASSIPSGFRHCHRYFARETQSSKWFKKKNSGGLTFLCLFLFMLDCLYPKELLERNREIRRKTGFFILTCRTHCCSACFTPPAPHHSRRLHIYQPPLHLFILDLNPVERGEVFRASRSLARTLGTRAREV